MRLFVNKTRFLSALLILFFISSFAMAQNEVEMADKMRSEGKIYVVVTVMAIVFTGISIYLFLLDRKIGKIEKTIKEKNN